MTCINTGNAWVRVRNGAGQGAPDALPGWLSLHFWLLAVYLGGEQSSVKLGLGLFSFSRRWLLHGSIDNRIDLLRNFEFDWIDLLRNFEFDRIEFDWMERTRGVADRQTLHRRWPCLTFSIPFFKAGFVWITQISVVAGVESPLSFLERTRSRRENRRLYMWSWRARIEATVNCFLKAKVAFWGLAKDLEHQRKLASPFRSFLTTLRLKCHFLDDLKIGWEVQVMLTLFSLWWKLCMQPESSWAWPWFLLRGVQSCVNVLQVNVCLGILSARTCNADHGDILWKVGHIDMALTTGKAWAINWRALVGTQTSVHMLLDEQATSTSPSDHIDLNCTGELEILLLSHLMPFIKQHHHLVPPWYTHAHAWTHRTPARAPYLSVRMAVNNRRNIKA